jgi:hypothetical protein
MTLDEFRDKYCGMCGSQRCLASDEDIAECGYNPDSKDPLEDVLKAVKEGMEMNKLTHPILRDSENQAHESEYSRETLLHRLAAYEDTGLEPEEVAKLAQAKADGRLVVLPCKVGDAVYRIISYKCNAVCNKLNACNSFIYKGCKQAEFYVCSGTFQLNDMWWIGKTVFLTRAEAEAALKGAEHDD